MTPATVQRSEHRGWRLAIGVLAVVLVAAIVAVPRVISSLLEEALRSAYGEGRVAFAWPARLRVEGLRVRLAAGAEPVVTAESAEIRIAPLRWLVGKEFLEITLAGPRIVLTRQADGGYDLVEHLRSDAAVELQPSGSTPIADAGDAPDDSAEPAVDAGDELRPGPTDSDVAEPDASATAVFDEHPSIDGSLWTRTNDPFVTAHGTLAVAGGALVIADPRTGDRTELDNVTFDVHVRPDELITVDLSARQRGRDGREGSVRANGRVAFAAGERFWYDPVATLRRIEFDAEVRLAPCVVGDVEIGGELRAAVHDAHATMTAEGVLNGGTASAHVDARVAPAGRALVGERGLELRNVGLVPSLAPILAPLNPIFDVGTGRLAGRLDMTWRGEWSESPRGRQLSDARGRIDVKELASSGAPLTMQLLGWLGAPGDELAGDLSCPDVRARNGRIAYERMVVAGRERDLIFRGAIAADGVLRLTCEAADHGRPTPAGSGAPRTVAIVGWVDDPRLQR